MLINTWSIPHRQVVGGGYNDMFGYQWGVGSEPNAFRITNAYGQTIRNTNVISLFKLILQCRDFTLTLDP